MSQLIPLYNEFLEKNQMKVRVNPCIFFDTDRGRMFVAHQSGTIKLNLKSILIELYLEYNKEFVERIDEIDSFDLNKMEFFEFLEFVYTLPPHMEIVGMKLDGTVLSGEITDLTQIKYFTVRTRTQF